MSRLTEAFSMVGVFNTHNFAQGNVVIHYRPVERGRAYQCAAWQISKGNEVTDDDPQPYWRNYKKKTFDINSFTSSKVFRLQDAIAWASEKYGIKAWAKTPYGSWMDAAFVTKRVTELKAAAKEKEEASR